MKARLWHKGFTIVELVIVVIVIGIIATITVISYNAILGQNREKALEGDLYKAATQLHDMKLRDGSFPVAANDFSVSNGDTTLMYSRSGEGFCVSGVNSKLQGVTMYVTDGKKVAKGVCPALVMQTIAYDTCPENRTLAVDARDNRTYWIQLMPDGNCWMLTNLAYAGGGTNTYSDVKTLQNGTSDTSGTYTAPKYYIHANANPSTNPAQPSTDTTGGGSGTGRQYGYHYNWCAAMGVQTGTSACLDASTPLPSYVLSICPDGWRLPMGGIGGEFQYLATAIGATNNAAGSAVFRSSMLAQQGGRWLASFHSQGTHGFYWSSSQHSTTNAFNLFFHGSAVVPSGDNAKTMGNSIRCMIPHPV